MEKVILTQEQAEAIEGYKMSETGIYDFIHDLPIDSIFSESQMNHEEIQYNLLKVMNAFVNGYEVEPEFKAGDWKVVEYSREIGQVVEYFKEKQRVELDCNYFTYKKGDLRDATPEEIAEEKERRWWEGIGRCVRQFKEGDIVNIRAGGILHREVNYINHFSEVGVVEDYNMYRPTECELVCRVEDRKDVKE